MQKKAYPQPDFARNEWLNLNGSWEFSFDTPDLDQTIEVPYPWGSPLSGIEESRDATAYYHRTVRWNPAGERIFLIFGAVDYTCEVTVNGVSVGTHRGGYSRFEFDVSDLWKREEDNEILVCATDTAQRSQTYGKQGYGDARGIWQTVWLEARPAAYIRSFFVQTKLDGTVTYDVELSPAAEGQILTADFAGVHAEASVQNGQARLVMNIENPALWSPEDPYLYEGTLAVGGDVVSTYFGIREIGTDVFGANNRRYITLNGKPYFINGVLDQSFNPQGFFTLPSDEDCREEILRAKRLGINMMRIHIKAEDPLKLYWADRLGMLIMADIPCFWGDPTEDTKAQYEIEMEDQIVRDRNHPALFYWVVFNESWGLFSHGTDASGNGISEYTKETADWVVKCYHRVKEMDPTRLVEDNSVCKRDHTVTDVNSWHFYSNGYTRVKGVIDDFCNTAYIGTQANYKEGYTMGDVPCMNSECGAVWGVKGNAGDSDIAWQYKYMINEFRLHDKLCGFIFTEFHDVVNEFNGYYKINNDDKDFGYGDFGMNLRDLHSQDYLGADFAPMTTVNPYDTVSIPLVASSFTDARHGRTLRVDWQLTVMDPLDGDYIADSGEYQLVWSGYGAFPAGEIHLEMPAHDGTAVLSWALMDGDETVMQNYLLFDIDGGKREDALVLEPSDFASSGFAKAFAVQQGNKLNGLGGSGCFTAEICAEDIPGFAEADNLRIVLEASTRAAMTRDYPEDMVEKKVDLDYMLGYRCDAGENRNTFPQTDSVKNPGMLEVLIDGAAVKRMWLEDCPADARGMLSHHYQPDDQLLDEAGSYGYLCDIAVPSALLFKLKEKDTFTLTVRMCDDCGLSLYGRRSGRYGIGVVLRAE